MRERSKPEGWRREAAPLTRARPAARGGTRQEFRRHSKLMQRESEFAGAPIEAKRHQGKRIRHAVKMDAAVDRHFEQRGGNLGIGAGKASTHFTGER